MMLKTNMNLFKRSVAMRAFSSTTPPPEAVESLKKLGITNKNIVFNPT